MATPECETCQDTQAHNGDFICLPNRFWYADDKNKTFSSGITVRQLTNGFGITRRKWLQIKITPELRNAEAEFNPEREFFKGWHKNSVTKAARNRCAHQFLEKFPIFKRPQEVIQCDQAVLDWRDSAVMVIMQYFSNYGVEQLKMRHAREKITREQKMKQKKGKAGRAYMQEQEHEQGPNNEAGTTDRRVVDRGQANDPEVADDPDSPFSVLPDEDRIIILGRFSWEQLVGVLDEWYGQDTWDVAMISANPASPFEAAYSVTSELSLNVATRLLENNGKRAYEVWAAKSLHHPPIDEVKPPGLHIRFGNTE